MQSRIGQVVAEKYRLDALLGAGGFGAVYQGTHLMLDVPVAVKLAFDTTGRRGRRFVREARILMTLEHPRIVRMYDFGVDPDGQAYLVQGLVDGQSLRALLAAHGALCPRTAVGIASQVLEGLEAAHRVGVVHRDIKPDNVMLVGAPESPEIKLLDFGVAHHAEPAWQSVPTSHGAPGTPAYMSPEQFDGRSGPTTDVYAVGVMLYEMLTGRRPFEHRGVRLVIAHLRDAVPPLPPAIPPELAAVVHRALCKAPTARHASAAAMREALRAVADSVDLERLSVPAGRERRVSCAPGRVGLAPTLSSSRDLSQTLPSVERAADRPCAASGEAAPSPTRSIGAVRTEELRVRWAVPVLIVGAAVVMTSALPDSTKPPAPVLPGPPLRSDAGLVSTTKSQDADVLMTEVIQVATVSIDIEQLGSSAGPVQAVSKPRRRPRKPLRRPRKPRRPEERRPKVPPPVAPPEPIRTTPGDIDPAEPSEPEPPPIAPSPEPPQPVRSVEDLEAVLTRLWDTCSKEAHARRDARTLIGELKPKDSASASRMDRMYHRHCVPAFQRWE